MLTTLTQHLLAQTSLNRDLSNIHKWLFCNKLTLNTTETEFMLIGFRQKLRTLSESLELSIDNVPIKQVSTTKSLGILIDDNMAWHSHIDKLSKKIASGIGNIGAIEPNEAFCLARNTLLNLQCLGKTPFRLLWYFLGELRQNALRQITKTVVVLAF